VCVRERVRQRARERARERERERERERDSPEKSRFHVPSEPEFHHTATHTEFQIEMNFIILQHTN